MNIMEKSKYTVFGIIICLLLSLYSCNEDKGNYEYEELNEVTIEGIEERSKLPNDPAAYSSNVGEIFTITPELTFSLMEDESSYSFQWYVIDDPYDKKRPYLVSNERNLSLPIEGVIGKPGKYGIIFQVINKNTGIKYIAETDIDIQLYNFTKGYVMLTEKPGNTYDIDMVSLFNNQFTQYNNLLSLTNSELPIEGNPLGIVTFNDNNAPSPYETDSRRIKHSVYVLSDERTDRIKPEDFSYLDRYSLSRAYIGPSHYFPNGVVAEKIVAYTNNRAYMYANNNWYFYNVSMSLYLFDYPFNTTKYASATYKAAPYIFMHPSFGAILYDEDKKQFMVQKVSMFINQQDVSEVLSTQVIVDNPGDIFKFNNIDDPDNPIYDLIYMGNRSATTGYAIVKNRETGKVELLQFTLGMNSVVTKTLRTIFPDAYASVVENAKFFAYHPTTNTPYLYFATEDKVYRTLTTSMATSDITTNDILPLGYKISEMKYLIFSSSANKRNDILGIASYDSSGTVGENGMIKFFDTDSSNGELSTALHPAKETEGVEQINMQWTGMGKIIGFDYKFQ